MRFHGFLYKKEIIWHQRSGKKRLSPFLTGGWSLHHVQSLSPLAERLTSRPFSQNGLRIALELATCGGQIPSTPTKSTTFHFATRESLSFGARTLDLLSLSCQRSTPRESISTFNLPSTTTKGRTSNPTSLPCQPE